MTDMIERVAKAIFDEGNNPSDDLESDKDITLRFARAAIEAMREPTDAVMEAGCASNPPGGYHAGTTLRDIIGAEWRAMIDEALKEK